MGTFKFLRKPGSTCCMTSRPCAMCEGVRGSAGFPKQSFTRAFVETVSEQMRAALGDRWSDWGSEQVMSNIVVANIARATVLPHPKYADCHKMQPGATEFVHFIGGCRFDGGHYARLGAQVIDEL